MRIHVNLTAQNTALANFQAGSVPSPTAVLRLYADMEYDPNVGGCCGEIMVDRNQRSWRDPVIMSQVRELVGHRIK